MRRKEQVRLSFWEPFPKPTSIVTIDTRKSNRSIGEDGAFEVRGGGFL